MPELSFPKSQIKIALLENIHPKAVTIFHEQGYSQVEHLNGALTESELVEKLHDVHIIGIRSGTQITKKFLDRCTKLMSIGCFCIGTNQVDLREAMLKGIPVFNDPHSNTRSVAEFVIGMCISLMRDVFQKNTAAHAGQWNKIAEGAHEIRGKTLGIVGYGSIGSQLAIMAEAMGMHVCYYDVEQKLSLGNVKSVVNLEELIAQSDIVTLHVPETAATHHLIDRKRLKLFKKSAFLINTSRGSVVDTEALIEALQNKTIRGAALDVFEQEPNGNTLPFNHPLQKMANVILTPHIGGATEEAQENIGAAVSQKLINFINRGSTEGATNFPALSLSPNQNTHRILHVHYNTPGMLSQINKILSDKGINILSQYLQTTHDIGYVVFDIEKKFDPHLLESLKKVPGTIRARILY